MRRGARAGDPQPMSAATVELPARSDEIALEAAAELATAERSAACRELILTPAGEIVPCIFETASEMAVMDASRRAGLPPDRIVESVRIHPGRLPT